MTDKIQRVSNPLTIIAIFAGLAEIAATVALGLLDKEAQMIFLWFVMFFPVLLISLFFIVLWKRPEVLYSPSDYRDENNFMKNLIAKAETESIVEKTIDSINNAAIEEEVKEKVIDDLENLKVLLNEYVDEELTGASFTSHEVNKRIAKNRLSVLKLINERPGISSNDIAEDLDINLNLVKAVLKVLVDKQYVKIVLRMKKGQKSGLAYYITKSGIDWIGVQILLK